MSLEIGPPVIFGVDCVTSSGTVMLPNIVTVGAENATDPSVLLSTIAHGKIYSRSLL